jgi:hypothetical protein
VRGTSNVFYRALHLHIYVHARAVVCVEWGWILKEEEVVGVQGGGELRTLQSYQACHSRLHFSTVGGWDRRMNERKEERKDGRKEESHRAGL